MTTYPVPLLKRAPTTVKMNEKRVSFLEQRLNALASQQPVPGVIDPSYTTGDPNAYVNGSGTLTGPYQHLSSYTPVASDPVLLVPIPSTPGNGVTYVVAGKLT